MIQKYTKISMVALAAVLSLSACKGTKDKAENAADKAAAKAEQVVNKADLDPVEALKNAMAAAKATKGDGDPAIWKLSDDDTDVFFFGTVHILPKDVKWSSPKLDSIMADMDTLYLEADVISPEAQQTMMPLVMKYGMYSDGMTLTKALGDDASIVEAAMKKVGVPSLQAVDQFKPWMVGVQMQMAQMMNDGYDPMSGVEMIMNAEAQKRGVSMGYLESVEDQLKMVSGGTDEEQVEGLVFGAKTMDLGKEVIDVLVDEWEDGDVAGLSAMVSNPESIGGDDAYDRLLTQRNSNWVPEIEAILEKPGTKLVAVGAAHLVGPDSVLKMLEKKGHKIEVVQ